MRTDRLAVLVIFVVNGSVFGSWVGRMPALAAQVGATVGTLGLALLGATLGLLIAAPVAGRLTERFGARAVILATAMTQSVVLPLLALTGGVPAMAAVLLVLGFTVGVLDVSMNIAAVAVIRAAGRPMMPSFHAGFSAGGLLGSLGAALAAHLGSPPLPQFLIVAGATAAMSLSVIRNVPSGRSARGGQPSTQDAERPVGAGRVPIRRPVLWLLAVAALCSAIAEGATSDWSALLLTTERGLSQASAASAFAVFSVTMVIVRLAGDRAERRFGSYRLLAASGVIGGAGLLVAGLVPVAGLAYAGFAMTGIGLACVFPVALGLAGQSGELTGGRGEREIAFVTGIAYLGFLLGPPSIGGLATLTSLGVAVAAVGGVVLLMAPAARLARVAAQRERAGRVPDARDGAGGGPSDWTGPRVEGEAGFRERGAVR